MKRLAAQYPREYGRLRLSRILRRCLYHRGLQMTGMPRLYAGHWWIEGNGVWIRTTDALNFRVLPP